MEHFDELTPRARARITGGVYLTYFVLAIAGEVFLRQAGISGLTPAGGDAATLASRILANEGWLQLGVALTLISILLYVAITTLFYQLFKPVGPTIALLALAFGLLAMAITALGPFFEVAPLAVLKAGGSDSLALTFLQLGDQLGPISLLFSGTFQILNGYLIYRSGFLPRVLGLLLALAGAGYFIFLAPPVAERLLPVVEVMGFLGEVGLMVWLLVRGVNSERWSALAGS